MDILLPLIFQHVRELADLQASPADGDRYKTITPFPPEGNDFGSFAPEDMEFTDAQSDAELAKKDAQKANEYFLKTDSLIFDYSYGRKSEDFTLSTVCDKFYAQALVRDNFAVNDFVDRLNEKRDAFKMSLRSTVADLAQMHYRFTSYSPVQWTKIALDDKDIERLQQKCLVVYGDLGIESPVLDALVSDIHSISLCYSKVEYEFGYFDVLRNWIDPTLLERPEWMFASANEVIYGKPNDFFEENGISLMYAKRYFVVRNVKGSVKEHQGGKQLAKPLPVAHDLRAATSSVNPKRLAWRNTLLSAKLNLLLKAATTVKKFEMPQKPVGNGLYNWILERNGVPAHWERVRANKEDPNRTKEETEAINYRIAAIKCRALPRKPVA